MREIKGWYLENGYKMVKAYGHPFANKRGYIAEHRLVMEVKLGRRLKPGEVVHHINGNRSDNRLENLELLYSQKDHAKLEDNGKRNPNGRFVVTEPIFNVIKFRLFDRDRGITQIYTLNKLISTTFRRSKFEFRGRWTGLKDKNGEECFDGDIFFAKLTPEDRGTYVKVVYDAPSFDVEDKDGNRIWNAYLVITNGEVIGNIYSNPELIK